MVRLAALALAGVALAGCFNFKGDLAQCQQEGRCPLEDGGRWTDGGGLVVPPGGLCAQGLCWENPFPTGVPLFSLTAVSTEEWFAAGSGGVVVHVKGNQADIAYLARPTPPNIDWPHLTGLAQCSMGPSAMTWDGQLFIRSDAGYVPTPLVPANQRPQVVGGWTGPGPTCAFAAGWGGQIWVGEEDGGQLVTDGSPPNAPPWYRWINGLGGTSRDDLWLATDYALMTRIADGGFDYDTVPVPDGGITNVSGVCSLGGGDVFVSSLDGIKSRLSGWGLLGDALPSKAIACLPSGEVIAAGDRLLRRCRADGGCTDFTGPELWQVATNAGAQALVGSRTGDLALLGPSGPPTTLSLGRRDDLYDVAFGANGEGWAVGLAAALLHRTDAGWEQVDAGFAGNDDLYAVTVLSDGRVVVAGRGGVMRVLSPDGGVDKPRFFLANGTVVQNQRLNEDLRRIREFNQVAYAVGTGGMVMREAADGTWRVLGNTGTDDYYDMRADDAGTAWITGRNAPVLQSQTDGGWTTIRGPSGQYTFFTAFVDSQGVAWFAGGSGAAMRLNTDGGQDTFTFPGAIDNIIGFIEQPDSLYAIGQRSMYRYAGEPLQWEIIGPLPLDSNDNALQAVTPIGPDFFVAGGSGAILRIDRATWLRAP